MFLLAMPLIQREEVFLSSLVRPLRPPTVAEKALIRRYPAGSGNLDASHVLPAFDTSFNPRTDGTTAMEPSPVLAPAPPEGTAHSGGPQSTAAQFMFSASVIVHDFIASKIYPEVGRAQLSALIVGSDHSNMDTATPHEVPVPPTTTLSTENTGLPLVQVHKRNGVDCSQFSLSKTKSLLHSTPLTGSSKPPEFPEYEEGKKYDFADFLKAICSVVPGLFGQPTLKGLDDSDADPVRRRLLNQDIADWSDLASFNSEVSKHATGAGYPIYTAEQATELLIEKAGLSRSAFAFIRDGCAILDRAIKLAREFWDIVAGLVF